MNIKDVTQANVKFFNDSTVDYKDLAKALYCSKEVCFVNRLIKKALPKKKHKRDISVLDIGTGNGYLIKFLKEYSAHVIGADITHKLLVTAKSTYPDTPFIRADAYTLPFRQKSFDFIVWNAFLHHLYDYESFLDKALPLLKEGGGIFIGHEPNHYFYRLFYSFGKHFINHLNKINPAYKTKDIEKYNLKMVDYHQHFSPGINFGLIRSVLKKHGFKEIKIFYSNIALVEHISKALKFDVGKFIPESILTHFGPLFSVNFYVIARL